MRIRFSWRPRATLFALTLAILAAAHQSAAVDHFTQQTGNASGFSSKSVRFSPLGGADYYEACVTDILALPVGTGGANVVELADDGFVRIDPGMTVDFYGTRYDSVVLCSNGYVGFDLGDVNSAPTLENHFNIPKVSGFYNDLDPTAGGTISWKVEGSQLVVTYRDVPLKGLLETTVSFQIQFFSSGGLIVSWLGVPAVPAVIGLARGEGVPPGFVNGNLLGYGTCESACLNAITDSAGALARVYDTGFGLAPDSLDLDVNGISDYANLRLLDESLAWGAAQGHCTALAAWEENFSILDDKLDALPLDELTNIDREDLLFAITGMATIGSRRFPQNLVRFLGSRVNLGIGRDELNISAQPFMNWQGDVDGDGTCNYGEYRAAEGDTEAFIAAALDPELVEGLDECFGNEPVEEEGEILPEGETDGENPVFCVFPLNGANVVPPAANSNTGTGALSEFGDSLLLELNHNVPLPAEAAIYFGLPGSVGTPYFQISSLAPPNFVLLPKIILTLSSGFFVEVKHTGTLGNQSIRGPIICSSTVPEGEEEGAIEEGESGEGENPVEGEDPVEGEVPIEGEDPVEGEIPIEGEPLEGEIEVPEGEGEEEGEQLPIELCRATLRGNRSVPPSQTAFTGLFTVTKIGRNARIVLSHNCANPTAASINLGLEGGIGPSLLSFPNASSPIVATVTLELAQFLTRDTYIRVAFGGDTPGEIRANLDCLIITPDEEPIEGEPDGEGAIEGAPEAEFAGAHSADYTEPFGVISLTEVLRIVQYFNLGSYSCGSGEDGYRAGAGPTNCQYADFDYSPSNWRVDLFELLRIVQLYNAGGYEERENTEDGFAPLGAP